MLLFGVVGPQGGGQYYGLNHLSGLNGLARGLADGYFDCSSCQDVPDEDYGQCLTTCQNQQASSVTANASANPDTPWYWQGVTAITKGAVQAGTSALLPSGGAKAPVAPKAPWYSTPIGIGGIALAIVAAVMIFKR